MKYIKIFIIAVIIAAGFSFILYKLGGFNSTGAIFIGVGTVMLSYILPALQKIYKEQKSDRENI